jgi:IS30 family transposase
MLGGKSKGGFVTHAGRKIRYLVAGKVTGQKPKTFSMDNGSEFAEFKTLQKATGRRVYSPFPLLSLATRLE